MICAWQYGRCAALAFYVFVCNFVSLNFVRVYLHKNTHTVDGSVRLFCVRKGVVFFKHERLFVKILNVLVCAYDSLSFPAVKRPTKMAFR